MAGPLWNAARALAEALRNAGGTSRVFHRSRACPSWCLGGHHCSVGRLGRCGEHRSAPRTFRSTYGHLVATGIQASDGRRFVEVRLRIAEAEQRAAEQYCGFTQITR